MVISLLQTSHLYASSNMLWRLGISSYAKLVLKITSISSGRLIHLKYNARPDKDMADKAKGNSGDNKFKMNKIEIERYRDK